MRSKFSFLMRDSLKKKTTTKAFKIVNIILAVAIIALINLDSVIKMFGGDFSDEVNIYVIDNAGVYNVDIDINS